MSRTLVLRAGCALLLGIFSTHSDFVFADERVVHVAPTGSESAAGSAADPLALSALPQRLRELRTTEPDTALRVQLAGGDYWMTAPLHFEEECSGSDAAPVVIEAADSTSVRFSGGQPITNWRTVLNPAIRARLTPAAAKRVQVADLRAAGIVDFGQWCSRGHEHELHPAALEVFYRGRPAQLARWPNQGWALTRQVNSPGTQTRFTANQQLPRRWQSLTDVWAHGYWEADWSDAWQPVTAVDPQRGVLTIERSTEVDQVRKGARFCILNVLEELDQPGEWYFDRSSGLLYFWPPAALAADDVVVSNVDHLLTCYGASHITFRGVHFTTTRVCLAEVAGGEQVSFERCTFRNAGNLAVHIAGGTSHVVNQCQISDTGEGAIRVEGGDRATLTPANHQITGNHIQRFARTCHAGRPAIGVHGVGIRVAGNCIHDGPDTAILLQGNEHVIEGNEIHHVCLETADSGAIYLGHDWTERGNVIRGNCLHHLGRFNRRDVMGVYLDDFASGTLVTGNLFFDAGRAVVIGGGRDNRVEQNWFLGGFAGVQADSRGETWAAKATTADSPLLARLQAMQVSTGPYLERYPQLANLLESEPAAAKGNQIAANLFVCPIPIDLQDRRTAKESRVSSNLVVPLP